LLAACFAQKPAPKPDDWPIQNAMIGPNSPIEIRAGSSYQVQAMYPVPDGPLFPLKAAVVWSIEPAVKGISIDATGKITVDSDVPHGVTGTVLGDVKKGRRKLSAKLYVFRPEENPLIGTWHVDTRVACGESQEIRAAAARPLSLRGNDWKFHVQPAILGREGTQYCRGSPARRHLRTRFESFKDQANADMAQEAAIELELSFEGWQQDVNIATAGAPGRSGTGMRLRPDALGSRAGPTFDNASVAAITYSG